MNGRGAGGKPQRGAVLLLAMVFLLLLAIISSSVVRTSVLEFRMAGNDQFREEALQKAQAIAAALAEDPANFRLTGGVGYTRCRAGGGCESETLAVAAATEAVPAGVDVSYRIRRQAPLVVKSLPFRQAESNASSSQVFDAAIFEVGVTVDGSAVRLGSAEVLQGIAVRIASAAR
ncbi:PilX N-terminal domain-containing pilus assembly protein [Kineobactrum salinum]|uniref:Type 4 fimbrial biogenesis protein PilX N-terminal domain-containing protein n=1 Tax=Kineobactrum salinum TaxID=2708301 RepID=A0A6C0U2G5_9GAMM|nr:PilX N-terminal domain-containing pilus assembly protein [Kineobactrum salinum]QIB66350.1 hypothetical protein G3T16_13995 [Kineobactrum salinum]